jgi:hypothetical protein
MPDEQVERVIGDLMRGGHSRLARAVTGAAGRGLKLAEGEDLTV